MRRVDGKLSGGLRLMWLGECIGFAGLLIETIILLGAYFIPDVYWLNILLSIPLTLAILVGGVMGVTGLWKLRGEHTSYRSALFVLAAILVCTLLKPKDAGILTFVLDLLSTVLALLEGYLTIHATNSFLNGAGREDLRTEGKRVLWAQFALVVISFVSSMLTGLLVADNEVRVVVHLAVITAVMVVPRTLYLLYLKHSSEALHKNTAKKERKR